MRGHNRKFSNPRNIVSRDWIILKGVPPKRGGKFVRRELKKPNFSEHKISLAHFYHAKLAEIQGVLDKPMFIQWGYP